MKNLAIIPARGGSKRIPRKNIKLFMGKPIIAYSIEAAMDSGIFDKIMVSTDDIEIAEVAKFYGAEVPFLRSQLTSDDYSTTVDVLLEVIYQYETLNMFFDNACCIYSTAPFVTCDNLRAALNLQTEKDYDSVFSTVQYSYPIQRALKKEGEKIAMLWPEYLNSRSQDLEPTFHDAGQFYSFNVVKFKKSKRLLTDNSGTILLSELQVQDLDTLTDWEIAEIKYELIRNRVKSI